MASDKKWDMSIVAPTLTLVIHVQSVSKPDGVLWIASGSLFLLSGYLKSTIFR
jgi:hypothetical protein